MSSVQFRAAEIVLFDFISHETMHLPFNESYLRTLRAAFPRDRLVFYARSGHIDNLRLRISDIENCDLRSCAPFTVPFGLSRHNPLGGRLAARSCLRAMRREIAARNPAAPPLRLVALLGVDASLYAVVGRHWPSVSDAPLHMILHGQLGDAMVWRSRNPIHRAFDLIAAVKRRLPPSVKLVALELGVREAIAEIAPRNDAVITLEHPLLAAEASDDPGSGAGQGLKIAFLGNARRSKGFAVFVELAKRSHRPDLEFESIGVAAPDTADLDVSMLIRKPSPTPLSRQDYLDAARGADLVCLPLHSRAYDFTASGTVSDAISALKPLIALRNRTLDAIFARYGAIGLLADSESHLFATVAGLDRDVFLRERPGWVENLRKIRAARRPEALAPGYAAQVEATPRGR